MIMTKTIMAAKTTTKKTTLTKTKTTKTNCKKKYVNVSVILYVFKSFKKF